MHRQQVADVAANDDIRPASRSKCQVFVVLGIGTFPYEVTWLNPSAGDDRDVKQSLAVLTSGKSIEFRPEYNFGVFVDDLLRQQKLVRFRYSTNECPFWNAA